MEIKYLGHSCFRIRGKQASIVTDPFDQKSTGIMLPKLSADIVTVSHEHDDHRAVSTVTNDPIIVRGPGEYEVNGVRIYGYGTYHDEKEGAIRGPNTVYLIVIDDVRILHCGDLGHELSDNLLDEIGDVDILMIPVGGVFTISAKQAAGLVKKIEPYVVIPMHYKTPQHSEHFREMQGIDTFLREIGKEPTIVEKYAVTKDTLPKELDVLQIQAP